MKLGYMVERRSIIFSKLFVGRDLSAVVAVVDAAAAKTAAAGGGPVPGSLFKLTEAAAPVGAAPVESPPALVPVDVLGTGGSDVLAAELLLSAGG